MPCDESVNPIAPRISAEYLIALNPFWEPYAICEKWQNSYFKSNGYFQTRDVPSTATERGRGRAGANGYSQLMIANDGSQYKLLVLARMFD